MLSSFSNIFVAFSFNIIYVIILLTQHQPVEILFFQYLNSCDVEQIFSAQAVFIESPHTLLFLTRENVVP